MHLRQRAGTGLAQYAMRNREEVNANGRDMNRARELSGGRMMRHGRSGIAGVIRSLITASVVATLASFIAPPSAAAEDAAQPGKAQSPPSGTEPVSGRPPAPVLLSVEIVPDRPAADVRFRPGGTRPSVLALPNEPTRPLR